MRWFSKGLDCKVKKMDLRLMEVESRPIRELDEIKRETAIEIVRELKKTEDRLVKYFGERQQYLSHLVDQLEGRIMTLEAKDEFQKPRKVSKK